MLLEADKAIALPPSWPSFATSACFRLRLAIGPNHGPNGDASDVRHMHVRGLEVFGTILPPWRL